MMEKDENFLIRYMKEQFDECVETAIKKNHDYGGGDNPFQNFIMSELISGVPSERGILVRLSDKMSRINTLLNKDPKVSEESVHDTIMDSINYLMILSALRKWKSLEK